MDKVERYKNIVRSVIEDIVALRKQANSRIKGTAIMDEKRGHYLLYVDDWNDDQRSYGCYLHIEVASDGKVWLQHDGTDLIVGQELLDKGVLKEDLVLGWIAPFRRADSSYATG